MIGHSSTIFSLINLFDETIASSSQDKGIKIWDRKTNKCIKSLTDHSGIVYSLIKINDESLESGSKDKTIRVWNWKTHKCITIVTGHEDDVKA